MTEQDAPNDHRPHPPLSLCLLRHTEAESDGGIMDRDRPLSFRGREAAFALGVWMVRTNLTPDFILCSPALRTRETLAGLMESLPPVRILFPDALYNASAETLLEWVRYGAGGGIQGDKTVLVIAHNPGIHMLAGALAAQGSEDALQRLSQAYPVGTLSVLSCSCAAWADFGVDGCTLEALVPPFPPSGS